MATSRSELPRHELPVDDLRPLKVICIGAGASGILAGIRLPQKIPNLDLTIFEKNADVGGTWYENNYPGVASDIPSHGYQYSFADNHEWDHFYASGTEVYQYLRKVAKQYDVKRYIKFGHVFKGARWVEEAGKWETTILRLEDNKTFVEPADVVIKATGILNTWKWPEIPGLHNFTGKKIHTARYDTSFDAAGKSIAVIGTGSTGIQLVPALQPIAGNIVTYSRSKAWVSPRGPYADEIEKRGGDENFAYTSEEKEEFSRNPHKYAAYRREIETRFLKLHPGLIRGTEAHRRGAAMVQDLVKEKLATRPDIFERIKPEYPVGCKRLGAGPGYLEALCAENLELVTCGIKEIVADGVIDTEGKFRRADAIICATGFDTTLNNQAAPIFGQSNTSLDEIWQPEPQAYLGVCAVKIPNMFFVLGPNGAPMASFIAMAEFQVDYIVKAIQKIQREDIKSMAISERAKIAFIKAADTYFAKTVLTENCASWLKSHGKADGRIQAIWPGALGHARYTYENPRWEDFEYDILPELEGNPMAWLGNGMTMALINDGNLTDHLDNVDIPPIINKVEDGDRDLGS